MSEGKLTKTGAWNLVRRYEKRADEGNEGVMGYNRGAATLLRQVIEAAEGQKETTIVVPDEQSFTFAPGVTLFFNDLCGDQGLFMLVHLAVEALSDGTMKFSASLNPKSTVTVCRQNSQVA